MKSKIIRSAISHFTAINQSPIRRSSYILKRKNGVLDTASSLKYRIQFRVVTLSSVVGLSASTCCAILLSLDRQIQRLGGGIAKSRRSK
jgi:hypothetical protein